MSSSTSVSLAITSVLDIEESSSTVKVFATATGASLTAVTVIVNVPLALRAPSETV